MRTSGDRFLLQYGGEIREALIMIEGDDGSFELLAHGWLAGNEGDDGTLFAVVRSLNTDRVHLLVHDPDRDPRRVYHWHRIGPDTLRALQNRIVRLRGRVAEPDAARHSDWLVSASEKPVKTVNPSIKSDVQPRP